MSLKYKKNSVLNNKGQSAVEYILLISMATALVYSVLTSRKFKELFGKESNFLEKIRGNLEYSYRHTHPPRVGGGGADNFNYTRRSHKSYYNQEKGVTRFYGLVEKYPGE